jgi:cyclic pyranopterin phosphate synthase
MAQLTHFDDTGASRMVDVGSKPESERTARASGEVRLDAATVTLIRDRKATKGDVLEVARIAGIQAAKRTGELIPLCHPLPISAVQVDFSFVNDTTIHIEAMVKTVGRTGVEMEALTAVSVSALTIYDMIKSVDRGVVICNIQLEEKTGGVRGPWKRM